MRRIFRTGLVGVIVGGGALVAGTVVRSEGEQKTTFRSAVDLVAVDVQVVDSDGNPVIGLQSDQFEVSINGRRRRIAFVDYIQYEQPRPSALLGAAARAGLPAGSVPPVTPSAVAEGRIYMVAVDIGSFSGIESSGVVDAAQSFVRRLQPTDRVGLFVFPLGPRLVPTVDRSQVIRALDTVTGAKQSWSGQHNLSVSEVIDIAAESEAARMQLPGNRGPLIQDETTRLRRVQIRECGRTDLRCVEAIQFEANSLALQLEGQLLQSASGLHHVLEGLSFYPGRKTLVLLSGGMPTSDRPGGRPAAGDLARTLGQGAGMANTSVYVLRVDSSSSTTGRDHALAGHLLDQLAGASGGTMMEVIGSGEGALDRVLRETSSHYLLGVEPDESDRDGRIHDLDVDVDASRVTVRSRTWVVVPEK